MSATCDIKGCDRAVYRKSRGVSLCRDHDTLRRHGHLSTSEDSGELSMVDDTAIPSDAVIDLSGSSVTDGSCIIGGRELAVLRDGEIRARATHQANVDVDDTDLAIIDYLIRRWQATGDRRLLVELQVALNELL